MSNFNYSTGNPSNLVAGGSNPQMSDIKNSFADVKTYLNGHNISEDQIAASVFYPYRLVAEQHTFLGVGGSAFALATPGNHVMVNAAQGLTLNEAGYLFKGPGSFKLSSSDYTMGSKTPRLRLSVVTAVGTAPGDTFVYGLYPVTWNGTTVTPGTVVTGSTVSRTTLTASTIYRDVGSDFTFPTAGDYCFGVLNTVKVNTNSFNSIGFQLHLHWI